MIRKAKKKDLEVILVMWNKLMSHHDDCTSRKVNNMNKNASKIFFNYIELTNKLF